MIPNPIKRPVILFSIALLSLYGFSSCGDQKTESTATTTDTTSLAVQTTATSDSLAIIQNGDSAAPVATEVTNAVSNPSDKTKETETVKKTTDVKTVVTTTTTTIPGVKTAPKPVVATPTPPKPAVVAQPTPVVTPTSTPTPTPAPTPVVVPKPVVVATPKADDGGWAVPANYKTMKSPYPNDKESIALGKSLYGTHCKSCHGSKGEGNGPKANTIDTKMRSFLIPAFRSQSQGEIFYKSMVGRKDMPRFEKKMPDKEEQWAVVHYIMSL